MSLLPGVCNLCGTGCGHFLKTEGEKVVAVAPLLTHPVSQGRLCVRGWHIHELLATGPRIETPMIRENGALRPATYDEASAVVRQRLAKLQNPAKELGVLGSARSSNEDNFLLTKLAREVFGTTQVGVTSQASHGAACAALDAAFGAPGAIGSLADLDHAQYILVVGSDLTKLNPIVGSAIHRAARRGSRVVALSSTRTQMARLATRHLQQKPGAKRLVVNALVKAVIAARSTEPTFAEKALPGFAELESSLARLTPSVIETETGLPWAELQAEAQRLVDASSVMIVFSSGISGLDADTVRSVVDLAVLCGKMGEKGSGLIPVAGICNLQGSADVGLIPSTDAAPLASRLGDAGSGLRALFVVDHDDGVVQHRERVAGLDFVVYAGSYQNRFMELAHVVFPTTTFAEAAGTFTASDRRVQLSSAKTPPPAGVRPAWRLFADIAATLGQSWCFDDAAAVFQELAANTPGYAGMSHESLATGFGRHCERPRQLAARSLLPVSVEAPVVGTDKSFPFALMIGKAQHFWHQHNLMRKTIIPRREYDAMLLLFPEGYIELNQADAKALQVREKWPVKVSSAGGSMKIAVRVSEDVQAGSACVPYFINEMISGFLAKHEDAITHGEDSVVPIRIEKV